jgi:hypothetical protein
VKHHRLGLAGKITVDLVVCHPVESAICQYLYPLHEVYVRLGKLTGTIGKHCKQTNREQPHRPTHRRMSSRMASGPGIPGTMAVNMC